MPGHLYPDRGQQVTDPVQDVQLGLAADKGVDPGGVDAGVSQQVREADDILLLLVIGHGEEVAEIVGKDLPPGDPRRPAELLHPVEDIGAVQGPAGPGDKDAPLCDGPVSAVGAELFAELARQKDHPAFSLEGDSGAAGIEGRDRDEGQLADADAGPGQGLHDQGQLAAAPLAPPFPAVGRPEYALIFLHGQVLLRAAEGIALGLEGRDAAVIPSRIFQKSIQGRDPGIGC